MKTMKTQIKKTVQFAIRQTIVQCDVKVTNLLRALCCLSKLAESVSEYAEIFFFKISHHMYASMHTQVSLYNIASILLIFK